LHSCISFQSRQFFKRILPSKHANGITGAPLERRARGNFHGSPPIRTCLHAKYKHYLFKRIALDGKQRTQSTLSFNRNYKNKLRHVQKWNHFALYNVNVWMVSIPCYVYAVIQFRVCLVEANITAWNQCSRFYFLKRSSVFRLTPTRSTVEWIVRTATTQEADAILLAMLIIHWMGLRDRFVVTMGTATRWESGQLRRQHVPVSRIAAKVYFKKKWQNPISIFNWKDFGYSSRLKHCSTTKSYERLWASSTSDGVQTKSFCFK